MAAKLLGQPLMPWQQLVADVGGELDSDGHLAYGSVVVTVMRQSGKTTLLLASEVDRCIAPAWGEPQLCIYSAQSGKEAREKLLDDQVPILEDSGLWPLCKKGVRRVNGSESITFRNRSRIAVMASKKSSGHGPTVSLGIIDEAFKDEDDRREQALIPAMATRRDSQLMVMSTAGTDASTYLLRKVEKGREAAVADSGTNTAYFEWSIPADADIDDPEVWWTYMPALGWSVFESKVADARGLLPDGEFRRGFGNQPTGSHLEEIIPTEVWDDVQDPSAAAKRPFVFAVDVMPDRESASIAVAGGGNVEMVDSRPGTAWVIERCVDLHGSWTGPFVIDADGPVGSLGDDLRAAGVEVVDASSQDVVSACARFYDAVADRKISIRPSAALDAAVDGLAKRSIGDRFVWSRLTSRNDVTPLMAASLAVDADLHRADEVVEQVVEYYEDVKISPY